MESSNHNSNEHNAEPAKAPVIAVLISGSGSNLQALIDSVKKGEIFAEIGVVISNRPDAYGLERAKQAGIETQVIDHKDYAQRELFDAKLIKTLNEYEPDLVVLAGFMRVLTPDFVNRYEGRLLNIHPSLLPKYPGLNTHQRAIDAGDSRHGVTTHFVTSELDSGPNIIQAHIDVLPQDTSETLSQRVQAQEHVIYPITVKWFVEGRLSMQDNQAYLDKEALPETGLQLDSPHTLH